MKLTEEDKQILRGWNETEQNIEQIESLLNRTIYTLIDNNTGTERKISATKAVKLLGRKCFLSGLDRSTFHWSAVRELTEDENVCVDFDSSDYWKEILSNG